MENHMTIKDVDSPIDLKNPHDAEQWANEANQIRPWRVDFFNFYVNYIQENKAMDCRILEIGSGPGFLAKLILSQCLKVSYTAFDFSNAMHQLAQSKMTCSELNRAEFIIGDFKKDNWNKNLAKYDVIIIHQTLHELRHKAYAYRFHKTVHTLLADEAVYFVCDHIIAENGMSNTELFMNKVEHFQSLSEAGFSNVTLMFEKNALCLFKAQH